MTATIRCSTPNNSDDIIFGGSATTSCTAARATTRSSGAEALPTVVRPAATRTTRPCGQENNDCVIGLVLLDYCHPFNPGDIAPLRRRHEPVARERPRRRPPRRVPPLRRVRPAPRDPVQRRTAPSGPVTRHDQRPHLHRRRRPRRSAAVLPQLELDRGPVDQRLRRASHRTAQSCVDARSRSSDGNDVHLRRPRQRLDRRRHRPATRCRAAGATTCSTPTTMLSPGCAYDGERQVQHDREHLAQRHARHAPDLRGPRLRRRRPRRPDRQHRRRPPDRLGRRVQQLHRAVRAVRHRHRQPPGAAGAVRVPVRAVGRPGRRPDRARPTTATDLEPRNGEPYGELGLVTQKDHGLWQDQTGGPTDPQAGQHPRRPARRAALGRLQRRHAAGLRRRQRRLGGRRRRAERRGGLARQGRRGGLLPRPVPADLLRDRGVDHACRSRPAAGRPTPT